LPPQGGSGKWQKKVIYRFSSPAGTDCLTMDHASNRYGATSTENGGAVFELKRPTRRQNKWVNIPLFTFKGKDGTGPSGSLYRPIRAAACIDAPIARCR
jgi:hypothetical protein